MKQFVVAIISALALAGCVTNPQQHSSGAIVNVSKQGMFSQTWTINLLHGTDQVSEKDTEAFGVDPEKADAIAEQAQAFADHGQRVRLNYISYSAQACLAMFVQYSTCDVVMSIEPIK